jgi:steroid 5-alpha reductase family enzyme
VDVPLSILVAWLAMIVLMTVMWVVQRSTRNAGIVDVAWSFGTALVAVWLIWQADGNPTRRLAVATMVLVWGTRLGLHLAHRMTREEEDGRYTRLRKMWGARAELRLFVFYQIQAAWAVLFALPMLAVALNDKPMFSFIDILAIAIWLTSILGESIADRQLAGFKHRPDSKGQVCQDGLWKYSRHPNYFFEWLQWWAYTLLAIGSPWWWVALAGALIMLFFLLKVTGIPPTEARALESRGEAYRQYQSTTSAFFPMRPRKGMTHV